MATLSKAEYLKKYLSGPSASSDYADDRQHKKKKQGAKFLSEGVRMSSCDTAVIFWQTAAAAARWPVTADALARLDEAFRGD